MVAKKKYEIKHYKESSLPSTLEPNVVYYVLDEVFNAVRGYITTKNGIPIPFIDIQGSGSSGVMTLVGTGVTGTATNPVVDIATFVSSQLGNLIQLSVDDGKLVVNPITSTSLSITPTATELQIEISNVIADQINSALQPGDSISQLVNDAGYITLSEVPPFNPSEYDLEDFNNAGSDPYAHISDILETDLGYIAAPTQGTITSTTGDDAIVPLEDGTNAGLLSPTKSVLIDSAVQPEDLATVATTGDYNDLINIPTNSAIETVIGNDGILVNDSDPQNIELDLGNITPTSVSAAGMVTGSNLSGSNTGDQTSIVGISGIKTQFNSALTDGDFLFVGDAEVPLTFSSPLTRIGNTIAIPQASASTNGFLSSSDWTIFNNKGNAQTANPLSQFAATTSLQLSSVITDETGTGSLVFANSPSLAGIPNTPTPALYASSNQIANAAFVQNEILGSAMVLQADYALTGVTTLQKIFNVGSSSNGSVVLDPGVYKFEMDMHINNLPAVATQPFFGFLGTAVFDKISILAYSSRTALPATLTNAQMTTIVIDTGTNLASSSAMAHFRSSMTGTVIISTTGIVQPAIYFTGSVVPAVVAKGSFCRFKKMGTTSGFTNSIDII